MAAAKMAEAEKVTRDEVTTYHTLTLNTTVYQEVQKQVMSKTDDGSVLSTSHTHTRSIDDKFYSVERVEKRGRQPLAIVRTNVSEKKLDQFEQEWTANWTPILNAESD